jgi:mitochondrial fission process protein 1
MKIADISPEDMKVLLSAYDRDHDNKFSKEEIQEMVTDMNSNSKEMSKEVRDILTKFDDNGDGIIDDNELSHVHDLLINTPARVAGYAGAYARLFRYLAFTSDFGEALRPVVRGAVVNLSYAISLGYCVADVGMEAYDLHHRGYKTKDLQHPMTMTQCIVERSVFQGLASIAVPFAIIHTTVSLGRQLFTKIGRFQKFGPSVLGLSVIPLLPIYFDHPIEQAIESAFEQYGPWGKKEHHD